MTARRGAARLVAAAHQRPDQRHLHRPAQRPGRRSRPSEQVPAAVLLALLVGVIQLGITLLRLGDLTRYISHGVIVGFTLGAGTPPRPGPDEEPARPGRPRGQRPRTTSCSRFWLTMTEGGDVHCADRPDRHGHYPRRAGGCGNSTARLGATRCPIPAAPGRGRPHGGSGLGASGWTTASACKIVGAMPPRPCRASSCPDLTWEPSARSWPATPSPSPCSACWKRWRWPRPSPAAPGRSSTSTSSASAKGLANLAGSFFQCFPGSGSLTRSAVNQQAGAVSQWSGVFAAAAVAGDGAAVRAAGPVHPAPRLAGLLMLAAFTHGGPQAARSSTCGPRASTPASSSPRRWRRSSSRSSSASSSASSCRSSSTSRAPPRSHLTELTVTPERRDPRAAAGGPAVRPDAAVQPGGRVVLRLGRRTWTSTSPRSRRAVPGVRVVVLRLKRVRNPDAVCLVLIESFLERLAVRRHRAVVRGAR